MKDRKSLARVILRSDGFIHIAFEDIRSIWATAENILELFSDPMEFIKTGSRQQKESTMEINRNRVPLDDVLGLTLAFVNTDKQIICEFPELFQFILSNYSSEKERNQPLNMKSFENVCTLSDEKSFLLQYYLEFTGNIKKPLTIKNNLRLRDEVQFEIIREILNTYFDDELPEPKKKDDLNKQLSKAENSKIFKKDPPESEDGMLSTDQYAALIGVVPATVRSFINQGRLETAVRNERGYYLIHKDDRPKDWDRRKGRKRKSGKTDKGFYKRAAAGSAADVEEHIKTLHLFSDEVARFIRTFEELDYYTKKIYHELRINGRPILCIDVNPDYINTETGERNRERMKAGKPPCVPSKAKEEYVFHVHHVGQSASVHAPFAIIPMYDHNGRNFSSIFHQGTPVENLHGPEFEAEKVNLWKTLLEEYDKVGGKFTAIPYLNPIHKRQK